MNNRHQRSQVAPNMVCGAISQQQQNYSQLQHLSTTTATVVKMATSTAAPAAVQPPEILPTTLPTPLHIATVNNGTMVLRHGIHAPHGTGAGAQSILNMRTHLPAAINHDWAGSNPPQTDTTFPSTLHNDPTQHNGRVQIGGHPGSFNNHHHHQQHQHRQYHPQHFIPQSQQQLLFGTNRMGIVHQEHQRQYQEQLFRQQLQQQQQFINQQQQALFIQQQQQQQQQQHKQQQQQQFLMMQQQQQQQEQQPLQQQQQQADQIPHATAPLNSPNLYPLDTKLSQHQPHTNLITFQQDFEQLSLAQQSAQTPTATTNTNLAGHTDSREQNVIRDDIAAENDNHDSLYDEEADEDALYYNPIQTTQDLINAFTNYYFSPEMAQRNADTWRQKKEQQTNIERGDQSSPRSTTTTTATTSTATATPITIQHEPTYKQISNSEKNVQFDHDNDHDNTPTPTTTSTTTAENDNATSPSQPSSTQNTPQDDEPSFSAGLDKRYYNVLMLAFSMNDRQPAWKAVPNPSKVKE